MLNFKDIAKIFEEIELRLISSLKRNLARHKQEEQQYGFDWSAWQAEKLRNINKFRHECSAIMNEYQNIIDTNTRQIMLDEFAQGMNGVNVAVPEPVPDTSAEIVREPHFFGVDDTKINKLIDDVVNLEKHAETAVLRTMDDVYRQTVNKAQLAMSTGSITLQKAIDMSVKDFLEKGINCIVYRDGRRVNIADYVRMALRTTATRAALQGMSAKIRQLGYDTVLVSSYGMCSNTCLPWQGRPYIDDVFSMWDGEIQERSNGELWGKSHYCKKWFPLLSTAIHAGLFHPNCRHTMTMWRDGDPIPPPQDNSEIQRRYRLEQKQRRLENNVRKAKRFVEGQSDPDNLKEAKKRLREAQKELHEFIANTNQNEGATILKRDYGREKIYTVSVNPMLTQYNFDKTEEMTVDFSDESCIIESGKNYGKQRGQIDIPYDGIIDESDLPEFNQNALQSIIEETGYSKEEAKKFHKTLIEWLGGDYEEFTAGNRTEQEKIINEGLARMGAYDGVIGRGMAFSNESEYNKIACLEIGESVPGKSVYAWSSDMETAKNYSAISYDKRNSVLLICDNNKTGVGVQHISKYGKIEAEVLAPSTTKYEIIDKQIINKYDYFVKDAKSSDMSSQEKEKRLYSLFERRNEISKYSITILKVKEV